MSGARGIVEGRLDAPVTLAFILGVELPRIIPFGGAVSAGIRCHEWIGGALVSLKTTPRRSEDKSAAIHM
jgi:hypothetical protein